jgi:hypothetical protein
VPSLGEKIKEKENSSKGKKKRKSWQKRKDKQKWTKITQNARHIQSVLWIQILLSLNQDPEKQKNFPFALFHKT